MSENPQPEARRLLQDHYGSSWHAPYAEGKTEMAATLARELGLPFEEASKLVNELERKGTLVFQRPDGGPPESFGLRTDQQRARDEGAGPTFGQQVPPVPELGAWNIAAG